MIPQKQFHVKHTRTQTVQIILNMGLAFIEQ